MYFYILLDLIQRCLCCMLLELLQALFSWRVCMGEMYLSGRV